MTEYKGKILVVDDEEDMTTFVGTLLEDNGYSVVKAADGKQGMAKAKSESPDLVILDICMPEETWCAHVPQPAGRCTDERDPRDHPDREFRTISSGSLRLAARFVHPRATLISHRTASNCWRRSAELIGGETHHVTTCGYSLAVRAAYSGKRVTGPYQYRHLGNPRWRAPNEAQYLDCDTDLPWS